MKRILPLFILLFGLSFASYAQIEANPNPVEASADVNLTADVGIEFYLTNKGDLENLLWSVEELDAPDAWEVFVCDANLCYAPGELTCNPDKPNVLEQDSSFKVSFHVLVAGTQGVGTYNFNVYSQENPNEILVTVPITLTAINSDVNEVDINRISMFPNPTHDVFQITDNDLVTEILVYNIVGKQVKSFEAANGATYDVSDLTKGIYLVRLIDETGDVLKVNRLSKR